MARHKVQLTLFIFLILVLSRQAIQAEVKCDLDHAIIDGVRIAYATPLEVVGRCVNTDHFDLSCGVATLEATFINGRANEDRILLHLNPAPVTAKDPKQGSNIASLEATKSGNWYKVYGYLVDGNAYGSRPTISFVVNRHEAASSATPRLSNFMDREAHFEGTAAKQGMFDSGDIRAKVDDVTEWPGEVVGKRIGVRGTVRRDVAGWHVEHAQWWLVDLADQLQRKVSLDGRFWSLNDHWWFEYQGERLYVTDRDDCLLGSRCVMITGPGGNLRMDGGEPQRTAVHDRPFRLSLNDHGRRARVSGELFRQLRPSLEQISLKSARDLVPCYVVRRATVEYLEPAIEFEQRFRTLYSTPCRIVDGVPELVPEHSIRRNIMGNETTTLFFYERNAVAIEWTLRNATPQTWDVLARRIRDEKLGNPLRLLYAAMLAAANDPRGRDFLIEAARTEDERQLADALYCLGAVGWLMPKDAKIKTELAWAEPTLVRLMSRRDAKGQFKAAHIAAVSTSIPGIMLWLNTDASRKALIDFALSKDDAASDVLREICESGVPLPVNILSRFEASTRKRSNQEAPLSQWERRAVLSQYLRQKNADAVRLFLADLEDDFAYMDFRDNLSPVIVEALKAHLDRMSDKARKNAQMLIFLGNKNPTASLLALLDDPKWKDKNLVLFELARLRDPLAVVPVARKLREAPKDYFHTDSKLDAGKAVEHALNAIADTGSKEKIDELIRLLHVDLSRFGTYIDREGFRRIIAAHLIELTGESFGVDADAWRKWWDLQRSTQ